MSAKGRIILLTAILAGLGLVCLAIPFATLAFTIRPTVYPGATYVGTRPLSINTSFKGTCFEWFLGNRWSYQTPDEPANVLHWFQSEGWQANYRYSTVTLLQSTSALDSFRSTTFRDVYIAKPGNTTLITASSYYTLAIGNCIPNPSGIPIP